LFTTVPLFGVELLENKNIELGFIITSLIIGCFALYNGCKKQHHKISPLIVFVASIMLLFFANFSWKTQKRV